MRAQKRKARAQSQKLRAPNSNPRAQTTHTRATFRDFTFPQPQQKANKLIFLLGTVPLTQKPPQKKSSLKIVL
ncbi:hypothetical protein CGZ90_07695 [Fictibacillus aquaticus]|uniref:Uncharacterized protein n=1 Tax=Fictibacillus aquaticus TaxID=2021314 RepID=A0A235FFM0_9BACL|nr:hypothetical protein CGZ90_07695 [Fictibacillus aquaticus]